jgi:hypothetical protein
MSNMMMGDMAENPPSPEELKVRSPAIMLLLSLPPPAFFHEGCDALDKGIGTVPYCKSVLGIRDILVQIRGSAPLTNGSVPGSTADPTPFFSDFKDYFFLYIFFL